jgi:beta-galactosidase
LQHTGKVKNPGSQGRVFALLSLSLPMPTPLKTPMRSIAIIASAFIFLGVLPNLSAADVPADASNTISLAGDWRFAMDPSKAGVDGAWFNKDLTDKIKLPGILQAQGYGDDIAVNTPWVAALGLMTWRQDIGLGGGRGRGAPGGAAPALNPPANSQYAKFLTPGDVKVPFMVQPPKHYLGVAWYQRDIDVPQTWAGKRVDIFLERARWQSTVYVDDKPFAPEESLTSPHVTDLGVLTPGKHRLTIRIDNSELDNRRTDGHSVTDGVMATWNGIIGRIELQATSPVRIYDAQVYPDVQTKTAVVNVSIANSSGQAGQGTVTIGNVSAPVNWTTNGGAAQLTVNLGANAQTWDEFHPTLQHLTINLKGANADDTKQVTFGLRQITFQEKNMFLNGKLLNLRMTHFGGDFPQLGHVAMDVDTWKKIIQTCKDYGLNGMRFHSWCPPDAAFVAADELGFYFQPEGPFWDGFSPGSAMSKKLDAETESMRKNYGNHPSFLLMSPSNESSGAYGPTWAATNYQKDPRRLYATSTGIDAPTNLAEGVTYAILAHTQKTFTDPGAGGQLRVSSNANAVWFGGDYRDSLTNVHIPVLAHELGQWCAYPDFDVIKEFAGAYARPGNYEIFRDSAAAHGVLDRNHEFAWASGKFQLACYKAELETNMRTPGLSGFQLLELHDQAEQGTALIGVVDAFWQPKSYVTAAEFKRFAGPTVPLARLTKRIYMGNETLDTDVEIYNFADQPFAGATPYWKLVDLAGKTAAEGTWPARDIPIGKNIALGHVTVDLSKVPAPREYRLVVGLTGTKVENDWNLWLYPTPAPVNPQAAGVFETDDWNGALDYLSKGGKVLYEPGANNLNASVNPGLDNVPVFWNRQMNPNVSAMLGLWCNTAHPALAEFPTEGYCDWQWADMVRGVHAINLGGVPAGLKPIVSAVDDWNRNWKLGVIFEAKVGPGRLMVSAIPLLDNRNTPNTAGQLRRSLLDYMATDKFQPETTLTPEQANAIGTPGTSALPSQPIGAPPPEIDQNPSLPANAPAPKTGA